MADVTDAAMSRTAIAGQPSRAAKRGLKYQSGFGSELATEALPGAPGGASLHNCMSGHGPDAETFETASRSNTDEPQRLTDTMAFMFESRAVIRPTRAALEMPQLQKDYWHCWHGLKKHFDPSRP